ncbi:hypothetical protein [Sphingomonas sp. GC_Shp_4]|uniref:hypothetical protein n=1 Tax=Sphingomonas sp. GC_Shp_4 TaxID=2937382 RepID=UPI00226B11A3|nr:hypothetical protein [Sphingomonas sp. GC_Shp_4]
MAALRSWTLNDVPTKPFGWADTQDAATVSYDASSLRLASFAFKGSAAASLAPLTPYTAATAPLYNPTGFNGSLPAITFSSSRFDLIASASAFGVPQPATGVFVWQEPAATRLAYEVVVDFSNSNGANNQTLFGVYGGTTPIWMIAPGASVQIPQQVNNPLGSVNVLVIEFNGANSRIFLNGAMITPASNVNQKLDFGSTLFGTGFQIGGKKGDTPTAFNGAFGEFAIIPAIFGAGDTWDRITQGTMWKWGQQDKIASGATYKAAAPTVIDSGGPTLAAGNGAIIITGRTANLLLGHALPAARGAVTFNGQAVRVAASRRIISAPAALALVGQDASLRQSRLLAAQAGVLAMTGAAAALARSRQLTADRARLALYGQGANLLHGFVLPAQSGTFVAGGQPATLRTSHRVVAEPGALQFVGQSVTLARSNRLALDAGGGSLLYSGQPAMLRFRRRLLAGPGAFAAMGLAAALGRLRSLTLGARAGVFALVGPDARPLRSLLLQAGGGSISYVGQAPTLRLGHRIRVRPTSLVLSVGSATLSISGGAAIPLPPPEQIIRMPRLQRRITIPAKARLVTIVRDKRMLLIWPNMRVGAAMILGAEWGDSLLAGDEITDRSVECLNGLCSIEQEEIEGTLHTVKVRAVAAGQATIVLTAKTRLGEDLKDAVRITVSG